MHSVGAFIISFLENRESFEDRIGYFVDAVFFGQKFQILRIGYKTGLDQHRRHRSFPQDIERVLMDAPVMAEQAILPNLPVDIGSEEKTLLVICVLHQMEEYERLRIVRVETLISRRIVILQQNNAVLPLADVHIVREQIDVLFGGLPHYVGRETVRSRGVERIYMERNKEIGLISVSNIGACAQSDETVVRSGADDFHIRIRLCDTGTDLLADGEGEVLFADPAILADSARVRAPMAGVKDDSGQLDIPFLSRCRDKNEKRNQGRQYALFAYAHLVITENIRTFVVRQI